MLHWSAWTCQLSNDWLLVMVIIVIVVASGYYGRTCHPQGLASDVLFSTGGLQIAFNHMGNNEHWQYPVHLQQITTGNNK